MSIRNCTFPACGHVFTVKHNSSRTYCDKHLGGRLAEIPVRDWKEEASKVLAATNLPPVPAHIGATRIEEMGFDTPQEAIALFSDYHWGSKIDPRVTAGLASYDASIARTRLTRWRDALLRFTQMDQYLVHVDTLHLLALGDDLEGHGQMFATQALQLTDSVGFQAIEFVRDVSQVLIDFLSRYKKIKVYKVRGNHGRIGKSYRDDYPPDNLELLAWHMIADRVSKQTGGLWTRTDNGIDVLEGGQIDFYLSPAFMMFIDILGYSFALRHGDRVGSLTRTYTGLVDNKLRLNSIVGKLVNYYMVAHHHEAQNVEHEIGGEAVVNGCFVGPSLLSVSMNRPAANIPSQELFLLHPRHGLTHRHRIKLASVEEMRELIEWTGA